MMLKKLCCALFCAVLLAGCGASGVSSDARPLRIVATIMPEYDWVMNILGENPAGAEVTLLQENGSDLHSYQPSAQDILKISECDVFICVGGESDRWTHDALRETMNPEMTVIRLLDTAGAGARTEELPEGAEEHEEGHEEEPEYDEHIWLSLRSAETLVNAIAEVIAEKDPDHREVYETNASAYTEELRKLDGEYEAAVSEGTCDVLLFGDRFPFRYLTDDYGLSYYAAFAGCSAETEASFETVLFLAHKLDELGLKHVMTIDGSDGRIAKTIIENSGDTGRDILTLNSMQGGAEKNASYLDIMTENLEVLKKALN